MKEPMDEHEKLVAMSLFGLARDTRNQANHVPQNSRESAIVASRIILALAKVDKGTSRLTKVGIGVGVIGLALTAIGIYVSIQLAHGRL